MFSKLNFYEKLLVDLILYNLRHKQSPINADNEVIIQSNYKSMMSS